MAKIKFLINICIKINRIQKKDLNLQNRLKTIKTKIILVKDPKRGKKATGLLAPPTEIGH